jgi:hypothetical protein
MHRLYKTFIMIWWLLVVDGIFNITTVAANGHYQCFLISYAWYGKTVGVGTWDLVGMRFSYASHVTYLIATSPKSISCHFKTTTVLHNPRTLPCAASRSACDHPLRHLALGRWCPYHVVSLPRPYFLAMFFIHDEFAMNLCMSCIAISWKEIKAIATHGHSTSLA